MRYVYLHGFASGPSSGKARFFRDRFQDLGLELQVPDLAEGDFEHLTVSRQLEVIDRAVAGSPAVLLGSSLGGYLASLYAASHPAVGKLVLLAPAFRVPTHYPATLGPAKLDEWRSTGRLRVWHYAEGRGRDLHYSFYEDGIQYAPEPAFTQPALILHGTHDDVVPHAFSAEFARRHGNVTLRLLASDHELKDVLPELWRLTSEFLGLKPWAGF